MSERTVSISEDVYERLTARKREDEDVSDLLERLLDETKPDWREGFGTLSEAEAKELEDVV